LADFPALEVQFLRAPGPEPYLRERLYALLDDFGPTAIQEDEAGELWRVFFVSASQRDGAAAHLGSLVSPDLLRTSPIEVPDEDWARRSQQNLKAVTVDGLVIAPPWDVPGPRAATTAEGRDLPVVVIEPSTGFGTGHHATTRLCLRLLQQLELRGARVVDVGTGSGVLALAAWKLGAADVVAIDNDPDALQNARENIARNGAGPSIDIVQDDLRSLRIERADIVLANLTGAVHVRYADELRALANDDGYLILSGFAPQDSVVVRAAFKDLQVIDERSEGDWTALTLRRT